MKKFTISIVFLFALLAGLMVMATVGVSADTGKCVYTAPIEAGEHTLVFCDDIEKKSVDVNIIDGC